MTENPYDYLVAKQDSGKWLSLSAHLSDTAGITEYLLDKYLSRSFLSCCGMQKETVRKTAVFLALTHDIGKFTAFFQYKITAGSPKLRDRVEREVYGCRLDFEKDSLNHSLYSELILTLCGCPRCILAILGAHHGKPCDDGDIIDYDLCIERWIDIKNNRKVYGTKNNIEHIQHAWGKYIVTSLDRAGFDSLEDLPTDIPVSGQMLLSGLLIMADWIASNTVFFPLMEEDESAHDLCLDRRVSDAISRLKLPENWSPVNDSFTVEDFEHTFGFLPNDVQRSMLEIVSKSKRAGIYILEAPMGIGKTEAALAACSLIAGRMGKNGVFFGMPTQATANGVFPRIVQWGAAQSDESMHSIILKHGSSDLNEDFARLRDNVPDEYSEQEGLTVHSWFLSSKKSSLASFVVSTVDRLLMMALKRKHVMLLHLGLSEKVVIIDECHAYDAYMNRYLYRALEWLGAYNTPVILLSATLDAAKRVELISAYSGIKQDRINKALLACSSYPLLTFYDGEINSIPIDYRGTHRNIKCIKAEEKAAVLLIENALSCGACIGVIVNTVRRAQELYDILGRYNPVLCHAQYVSSDRAAKEKLVVSLAGKHSTSWERSGVCVIGTQVLEQSLDIDFDLLVTDIAPMDLLLQRIGRLHRHPRSRPEGIADAQCIILTDEIQEGKKTGSKSIYTQWLLNETLRRLPDEITLPDDISPLVQSVYSYRDESDNDYREYAARIAKMESMAQDFLLPKPDSSTLHNLLDRDVNDSEGNAAVRLGEPTMEVLLLKQNGEGTVMLLDGTEIPDKPSKDEYIAIASQTIRLPKSIIANIPIDIVLKTLDKYSRIVPSLSGSYLTSDYPILLLDSNNKGELLGFELEYSFEYGLKYNKKE